MSYTFPERKDHLDVSKTPPDKDVADIIKGIQDPHGVADLEFISCCQNTIALINAEREYQELPLYTRNHKIILIHEMYRTAVAFKGKMRKDRVSSVFYSHLIGSIENLVRYLGRTGLVSVLSELKHDWVEDIGKETSYENAWETIVDPLQYLGKLDGPDAEQAEQIIAAVKATVRGVTKRDKPTRAGATADSLTTQLRIVRQTNDARPVTTRLAEQYNNYETIGGHKDTVKQDQIMAEAQRLSEPLARIFQFREYTRKLVNLCMDHFNPQLKAEFIKLVHERMSASFEKNRDRILRRFFKGQVYDNDNPGELLPSIESLSIVPRGLDYYTEMTDTPYKDLHIEDLPIAETDPMYDIVITTKTKKRTKDIVKHIVREFGDDPGCTLECNIPHEKDVSRNLGIRITVFNPKFKRPLCFRINYYLDERRSKRGLLADYYEEPPKWLMKLIDDILSRTTHQMKGVKGVVAAARETILKPRLTVYTKDGDPIFLPRGANGIDFAAAAHGNLAKRFDKIYEVDSRLSISPGKEVDPFAPVKEGRVYVIKRTPEGQETKVHPKWLNFCQLDTIAELRRALRSCPQDLSDAEKAQRSRVRGEAYLNELSQIYNLSYKSLLILIRKKYHTRSVELLLQQIGEGHVNPLVCLAELSEEQKVWRMEVVLPHSAGQLDKFTRQFSEDDKINLDIIRTARKGQSKILTLSLDMRESDISYFDFLRKVLRLSLDYDIRIATRQKLKLMSRSRRRQLEKEQSETNTPPEQ